MTAGRLDHGRFMFQATMSRLLRHGDHAIEWIGSAWEHTRRRHRVEADHQVELALGHQVEVRARIEAAVDIAPIADSLSRSDPGAGQGTPSRR